ncbi:MFS general substrate transporter [Martensiomyces pterosporus]|nr:MFS general substrate transporter [Martensiomyces pterosporus]
MTSGSGKRSDLRAAIRRQRSLPRSVMIVACLALMVDNLCYSISIACLPHLYEDMHLASESKVGMATTMLGIGAFLTSIISGILSDRIQSRKLLNGLASGFVYPIATSTTADVYPNKLLGVQMSLLNAFNNNKTWHLLSQLSRVGPVLGGSLYDTVGVRGVSGVIMLFGGVLAMVVAFGIREPLEIRKEMLCEMHTQQHDTSTTQLCEREAEELAPASQESTTDVAPSEQTTTSPTQHHERQKEDMTIFHLVLQWQVLSAALVTLFMGMLAGSLENVLPIHTKDKFNMSASKTGLLFVLNGSIAIVLSGPIGWSVDWLIGRYGESMRTCIELVGLSLTGGAMLLMGFSTSFGMIIGADACIATTVLVVNIPVMSSFGDFVNGLGLNSMAQCYGIYNLFWAVSSTVAPPIATHLYAKIGFRGIVAGILTGLCMVCSLMVLGEPIWRVCKRWASLRARRLRHPQSGTR